MPARPLIWHCSWLFLLMQPFLERLFTADALVLWLLRSFSSLFVCFSWTIDKGAVCPCIPCSWAPHDLLISALCPVVVFRDGLHLLWREAALMRGGSCTDPGKDLHWPQAVWCSARKQSQISRQNWFTLFSEHLGWGPSEQRWQGWNSALQDKLCPLDKHNRGSMLLPWVKSWAEAAQEEVGSTVSQFISLGKQRLYSLAWCCMPQAGGSLSLRPAWSSYRLLGQPTLHSEILSKIKGEIWLWFISHNSPF